MKIFSKFRKSLYMVALIALGWVVAFDLIFKDSEEIFPGGVEVSEIITRLAYSLIAATIFYFIAVHSKEYFSRKRVDPILINSLDQIISLKESVLSELYFIAVIRNNQEVSYPDGQGAVIKNHYPSDIEIEAITRNVPLCKTRSSTDNWIQRLNVFCNELVPHIETIMLFSQYLSANEIAMMVRLRSMPLHSKTACYLSQDKGMSIANDNIDFMANELKVMFAIFQELEAYRAEI